MAACLDAALAQASHEHGPKWLKPMEKLLGTWMHPGVGLADVLQGERMTWTPSAPAPSDTSRESPTLEHKELTRVTPGYCGLILWPPNHATDQGLWAAPPCKAVPGQP